MGGRGPARPFLLLSVSFREPSSPPCWPPGTSPVGAVSGAHLLVLQRAQGKPVGSLESWLCHGCRRGGEVAAWCLWGHVALGGGPSQMSGTSRLAAGLGCKRKGVWLRHSSPQRFRFWGFACTHPNGLYWGWECRCWGQPGLRAAGFVSSWRCLWLGESILWGKPRKGPRVPLQPDGNRVPRVPPGWEGADPAGAPALLLPPYICTETQEQGQSVAAQPAHGRGLGAATSPPTQVPLLRAVTSGDTLLPPSKPCSWDSRGRDEQVPAVPRHGTNTEPGDCRAPPLAATSSPP